MGAPVASFHGVRIRQPFYEPISGYDTLAEITRQNDTDSRIYR
jgi:hypothetical protein